MDCSLPARKKGDLNQRATHFYRDLTPCLYDRGRLIVAPADSDSILAYDAATGLLLWETGLAKDVVHLLGVGGDALWASGEKLWHINVATGKVSYPWPEGPTPKGFGRGVLAGGKVYWPTVREIHVFDQRSGQEHAPIQLEAPRPSLGQSDCGRRSAADRRARLHHGPWAGQPRARRWHAQSCGAASRRLRAGNENESADGDEESARAPPRALIDRR